MDHGANMDFPGGLVAKNLCANAGDARDVSLIPGLGSSPGVGNGNPLQYSCLEVPRTEEPGRLQSMGCRVDMTEHCGLNRPTWVQG